MKQVTKSLLSLALLGAVAGGVGLFAWLLSPVRIAADPSAVEEVLTGLSRLRSKKRFSDDDPPPSPAAMGLETPAAMLKAFTDDNPPRELRIELGKRSEFNFQEYVRYSAPGAEPVVVMLASGSRKSLMRTPEQLYDRRVLGADTDALVRLRVEPKVQGEGHEAFTLERTGLISFRCTDPFEGEVDPVVVRRVLEGLSAAPVSTWLTLDAKGDLTPHGLHEPGITVTAWFRPQGASSEAPLVERKLFISPPEDSEDGTSSFVRVARQDQPWVGTAHTILWNALLHDRNGLKNKRLTSLDRTLVARMEIDLESGEHVVLERDEAKPDAWRLLAPEPGRAKPQVVNALVLTVSDLTGTSRVLEGEAVSDAQQLASLGLGDTARRLRLLAKGGDALAVLRLGKAEGDDVFVWREGADFVARVPKQLLGDIPLKAIELHE
jgi:hypothetical protein